MQWVGIGQLEQQQLSQIAHWSKNITDDSLPIAISVFSWSSIDDPVSKTILENLPLASLSGESLNKLASHIRKIRVSKKTSLSETFPTNFIKEIPRIASLESIHAAPFWHYLSEHFPKEFYTALKQRVINSSNPEHDQNDYYPIPRHIEGGLSLHKLPEVDGYDELCTNLIEHCSSSEEEALPFWRTLFTEAVLRVSSKGIEILTQLVDQSTSPESLENIIRAMEYKGSMLIFQQPELTLQILKKIQSVAPFDQEKLEYLLAQTAAPNGRSYTNHILDTDCRYYRKEAEKCLAIHAHNPDLVRFYKSIIRAEQADESMHQRWATLDQEEW